VTRIHLRGTVLPDGVVRDVFVTDEGTISFDGSAADARTVVDGGVLIPGLVDAHAHLGLASPAPPESSPEEQVRASARAHLAAGVLAVREPGGPHRASTGIDPGEGLPRVFAAGRFLAPPGGYIPGLAREVAEEELPDAAVEELEAGRGGWAKVIGDWFGPEARLRPNFRADTLAETARRVHDAGGRLAVHVSHPDVIDAAIDAGFDSLEHCTALTEDRVARIAQSGIAIVPTMSIYTALTGFLQEFGAPQDEVARVAATLERAPAMIRLAHEAGVTVLAGTDAGMGPHGLVREEIRNLAEAGIPAIRAIGAGSWDSRRFLGLPGIEEGAPADLVAFDRDPLEDLGVLGEPVVVALAGRLHGGSGV
jgi:imidazolonepropionase-like amidohydrolase